MLNSNWKCEEAFYGDVSKDWQPIETAPKDKVVLVVADVPTLAMFRNGAWHEGFWTSHLTFATIRKLEGEVTHWMPLPQLPENK